MSMRAARARDSTFVFGTVDVARHNFARGAFSGESQCGVECF
jgi:hypothetical protein